MRESCWNLRACVGDWACVNVDAYTALWSGTNKNQDVSTGALTRPFDCTALECSLHSLRSFPHSWESEFLMSQNDLVLSHSAPG